MRKPFERVCIAVLFCFSSTIVARGNDFVCHWANGPIEIDGKPDDAAWQHATIIENFRIPASTTNVPQTTTKARLLWDRQYLYFYAELEDHDLFADVIEHDGKTWDNDVFEIFLKPSSESTGYYEFQVNAAGTEMDMFIPSWKGGGYEAFKSVNAFHWKTQVHRTGTLNDRNDRDEEWAVEGRIPWLDFMPTGGRPDIDEVWRFALCRYDYTRDRMPELSSCAPLSKVNFHLVDDYAPLRFAGASETNTQVKQLATRRHHVESNVVGSPDPPLPYRAVRAFPNLKLDWPVDVQVEPGSRRFVIIEEKGSYGPTLVKRSSDDPNSSELELIADSKGVAYSIAFHPQFQTNGYMYIGSNGRTNCGPTKSRIVRYALSRTSPYGVIGEPLTIIDWDSGGHNGAAVTFGLDGMMYVTSGDGTSDSDAKVTGQDLSKLLAKVLRIDVEKPDEGRAYSVPSDNPFVGVADVRPETWAYGLRNPWRITTDSKAGHIWVGNNGQDLFEQAYLIEKGANYGWSVFEGSQPFYSKRQLGPTPHVKPTVEHSHSESRSLTGGVVYYGKMRPELQGAYIYGDYSTGKIWGVKHDGQKILWHREIADTPFQISAISIDPDGELIVVDHRGDSSGGLYHLEAVPAQEKPNSFPRKLSETNLFQSVANHQVAEGLIPYTVNAPFWSDGAIKSRFIGLPFDGRIGLTEQWAWDLPEETVLVKSFALEMKGGDPNSRQWIETRLMVKQQGEWVGYSYAWNKEQTDAVLVDASGRDQEFAIEEASGVRTQSWHYPSRTECMVCHSRAAGYVLGVSTYQMNKIHDYGNGVQLNQLDAIEAMGVFKTNWQDPAKNSLRAEMESKGKSAGEIDRDLAAMKVGDGQRSARSERLLGQSGETYRKLADPYESTPDLERRARSFLHANCAYCHIEAGGGNAKMNLSFYVASDRMGILDVEPTHHTFGKQDAKLIARGDPERSVLLHRVGLRGAGQMPQLSSSLVDEKAMRMLRQWVAEMKAPKTDQPNP